VTTSSTDSMRKCIESVLGHLPTQQTSIYKMNCGNEI